MTKVERLRVGREEVERRSREGVESREVEKEGEAIQFNLTFLNSASVSTQFRMSFRDTLQAERQLFSIVKKDEDEISACVLCVCVCVCV